MFVSVCGTSFWAHALLCLLWNLLIYSPKTAGSRISPSLQFTYPAVTQPNDGRDGCSQRLCQTPRKKLQSSLSHFKLLRHLISPSKTGSRQLQS